MLRTCLLFLVLFFSELAQAQDTMIFWADAESGIIYKYNPDTKKSIQIIDGVGFPWRLEVQPNSQRLFWSNVDGNFIESSNFDGKDIKQHSMITYPQGIAFDENQEVVYVSESRVPQIGKIDLTTGIYDTLLAFGENLIDPVDLRWDANHQWLFWSDVGDSSIYRLALSDDNKKTLVLGQLKSTPMAMEINSKTETIYWSTANGTIKSCDYSGSQQNTLIEEEGRITSLRLSEDGRWMYYVNVDRNHLIKYDMNTRQKTTLIEGEFNTFHVCIALENN